MADEALRHGIVSRVVPDEELEEVVMEMCREIASHPPFAVDRFRRTVSQIALRGSSARFRKRRWA